jgi:hypothetical protein
MTHARRARRAAALLILLAAAPAAPAAPRPPDKSALRAVPASAPLVIHVRGVEGTKERLVALIKSALPEVAPQAEAGLDELKNGIEGRKLRGLPKDGPVFLAFTEVPRPGDNPAKAAAVFAGANYAELRDSILKGDERKGLKANDAGYEEATLETGEPIFFVDGKDYAAVFLKKEVAAAFTKKQPGLDTRMSAEQAAKFLAGDVGVYVNMDLVNKEYAEQIKEAREAVDQALKRAAEGLTKNERGLVQIAQRLAGPAFQAVQDSRGLLLTAEFRPAGLALHLDSEFRPDSPTAGALKDARPVSFAELDRLPAGQMIYLGLRANPAVVEALGGLMFGVADDKDAAAVREALHELAKAGPQSGLEAFSLPLQGVKVGRFADPVKAAEAQRKLLEGLQAGAAFQSGVVKEKPVIKPRAEKYGGFELTSVEVTWDFDKMVEGAGTGDGLPEEAKKQLAAALQKLLGERLRVWFGTDGKEVIQVTAEDWPAAQKLLDRYTRGEGAIGADESFRQARKELPAESTFIALADPVPYLGAILDLMRPIVAANAPLPISFPAPPPRGKPAFAGKSVTLRPDRASLDVFVSASATHALYKAYVEPLVRTLEGLSK